MASVNQNPEQIARDQIDTQLLAAGWIVQDKKKINLAEGLGIAVRESPHMRPQVLLLAGTHYSRHGPSYQRPLSQRWRAWSNAQCAQKPARPCAQCEKRYPQPFSHPQRQGGSTCFFVNAWWSLILSWLFLVSHQGFCDTG